MRNFPAHSGPGLRGALLLGLLLCPALGQLLGLAPAPAPASAVRPAGTGLAGGAARPAPRASAQDPGIGAELFVAKACASCHGEEAGGQYGPPLGEHPYSIEEFRRAIRDPINLMPAYDREELSEEELRHLHAYVLELSGNTPPPPTWRSSELLNLATPRPASRRTLVVHFTHRFSESIADAGREGLWGLDSFAFPGFTFEYGLTDRVSVYGGRTSNLATWEYGTSVALLPERSGEARLGLPLAVGAAVGGTFLDADDVPNASRFTLQLPMSLRAHERLSLLAVPVFATATDELGRTGSDGSSFAVGLGGSLHLSRTLTLDVEWIHNLGGFERPGAVDQWQAGLGIDVGGHLFQIVVTNSVFTTPDFMAAGTLETGVDGNARLGFNLVREFKF